MLGVACSGLKRRFVLRETPPLVSHDAILRRFLSQYAQKLLCGACGGQYSAEITGLNVQKELNLSAEKKTKKGGILSATAEKIATPLLP